LITLGFAFAFALLLAFDAVQIGVGTILLNEFWYSHPELALIMGFLSGFAFLSIADIVKSVNPKRIDAK